MVYFHRMDQATKDAFAKLTTTVERQSDALAAHSKTVERGFAALADDIAAVRTELKRLAAAQAACEGRAAEKRSELHRIREAITASLADPDPLDNLFDDELMEASNAALALFHAGRLEDTEVAARDLLVRFPDMPDGWEYLGLVHEKRGENREAAECYRRVLEIVRRAPEDYEPAFEQQFVNLIAKLNPPGAA
jgi:tetratricopeptide (TPR) repeat protein